MQRQLFIFLAQHFLQIFFRTLDERLWPFYFSSPVFLGSDILTRLLIAMERPCIQVIAYTPDGSG